MRRLVVNPDLCSGCLKCEESCGSAYHQESLPEKSAIRVEVKDVKPHAHSVCNQCGECMEICPVQAIYRDKAGVVRIRKADCVGCLSCVGFCPSLSMRYHASLTEPFKCVACGICARYCPEQALSVIEHEEGEAGGISGSIR